jgi:hypothetical protein
MSRVAPVPADLAALLDTELRLEARLAAARASADVAIAAAREEARRLEADGAAEVTAGRAAIDAEVAAQRAARIDAVRLAADAEVARYASADADAIADTVVAHFRELVEAS